MSEAFRITDEKSLSAALQWVVEYPKPGIIKLEPFRSSKWTVLHNKFEAMINEVSKHKGWGLQQREEFKKDCKVNWGKIQVRHDHISGRKSYTIPSINDYSEEEISTLIGELDVWCSENRIPLSR